MKIGTYILPNRVFAAPMAGIADRPFRRLCRTLGAGYAVGEMATADPRLRASRKTSQRLRVEGEGALIAVQIAGADPRMLADAARYAADRGAHIVDINMGCPAKKVCNAAAGSALLRDEALVGRILESVVQAVAVPITLKLRTGWSPLDRNALRVCRIAESAGIQLLTIHGRTRACGFGGAAEYDTIAEVKSHLRIPVVANGDIDTPEKAAYVLSYTRADAVMIGRSAQSRPWIFREIDHFLRNGTKLAPMHIMEVRPLLLSYLDEHHLHHGELAGARSARKRIHFLVRGLRGAPQLCERINRTENCAEQRRALNEFLLESAARHPFFEYIDATEALASRESPRSALGERAAIENQTFRSPSHSC